jgi:SAM-dependent methyltransferase
MRCLDVGCGTNPKSCHFWKHDDIILSDTEIDELKYIHKQYPNCGVICCSIECLPFTKTVFDNVLSYHVLEHIKSPEKALSEIFRLLKKEGAFYVAVPNGRSFSERFNSFFGKMGGAKYDHIWRYSLDDITNLLRHFNFRVKETKQLTFFRPLIAGLVLHLSIMLSASFDRHNYIYRVEAFSSKERPFFSAAILVIERIDRFITRLFPNIGAEIEVNADKQISILSDI